MTNKEMEEMIKVLARHIEFLEENISKLYDSVDASPIYASYQNMQDEAKIKELIYKY